MTNAKRTYTWRCGCGDLTFKIRGEPALNMNCHCHSCVAYARFVDAQSEKIGGDGKGTSILSEGDGVAMACFWPDQVKITRDLASGRLNFVKVGHDGKPRRSYAKCCGTAMMGAEPRMWALNRNCIFEEDADSSGDDVLRRYEPEDKVCNVMKKHAFDPEKVPEPSADTVGFGDMVTFFGVLMNPLGKKIEKDVLETFRPSAESTVEVVPITWE
uniref:CENP-V/GFA domain-containing protein n=1 Tax=Pseudictyota dubia TaxID=2749911 RepID=A0A7R9Z569_9STRA